MGKGEVVSFWMPSDLKEKLDKFRESYPDLSRSKYICSAIQEFLSDASRRYLVETPEKPKYFSSAEGGS